MNYVANAFSLQMLDTTVSSRVMVEPVSEAHFNSIKEGATSAVDHADTARLLGVQLNRISVSLTPSDTLYVAQVVGGRLPEGCTELPAGVEFRYLKIKVEIK